MSALWPGFLWALLLVPLAVAAYLLAQRRRTRYAARFTNLDLLADVVARSPSWRRHVPAALYLLGLTVLLLALARPQAVVQVPREQATVMLVMDVSGSMNARDVEPTRLVAAEEAANTFLEVLPERFRVGLVTFSGTAQMVARPTTDRDEVRDAIAALHAEGGTAMGDGIDLALDLKRPPPSSTTLPDSPPTTLDPETEADLNLPMVILLLSDGANSAGDVQPLDAAVEARNLDVSVFTVALGTPEGVVDVPDETGQLQRIPVPPDPFTLRHIADLTGGRFFFAPSSDDLQSIYQDLGSRIGFEDEKQEITVVFAAAALLLVVAAAALSLLWLNRFP